MQTNFVAVQFLYERGLLLIRENKKMKLVNKKKKQLKSILKKKKEVVIEVPKKLIKRKKN